VAKRSRLRGGHDEPKKKCKYLNRRRSGKVVVQNHPMDAEQVERHSFKHACCNRLPFPLTQCLEGWAFVQTAQCSGGSGCYSLWQTPPTDDQDKEGTDCMVRCLFLGICAINVFEAG
jgi:hypothetical protein